MNELFYYTGLLIWVMIALYIVLMLHRLLYYNSFYYSESFDIIRMPYFFVAYRGITKKQIDVYIEITKNSKRPSRKILSWYFGKINKSND